ncbi:MAG: 4-hydroxy-tetrahydrodipicolinate synthase [Lachnospiraceae bacterium]|nr:4-hydroxy-tetrahydrodipicolinate synthase [Lachnospiraceae bacterium]
MSIFKGAGVAMATPMKEDGSVNYDTLEKLVEDQIAGGTDAIISVGTSGEAPTLEDDEHLEVIRFCVEKAAGRIPVIAGTGSNNTAHAVMMSKEAQKRGADGCLLVAPYYNKATQQGLIESFSLIANSIDIPCILYNVPSRTGSNILPDTAAYLGKNVENIVAIKEASGNISQIAEVLEKSEGALDVYSGNDDQIVPIMSLGGIGVISVLSNVAPKFTHDLCMSCLDGDYVTAAKNQLKAMELCRSLFCEVNPIPVKAALNMMGYEAGKPRLPLTEMTPANKERLKKAMTEFGIL